MDLATIIVLILGVIVITPIYLVVRLLRRNRKRNRAQASKYKYDARVIAAMNTSMNTIGFARQYGGLSHIHTYKKRTGRRGRDLSMGVDMNVTKGGYYPHYTFDVYRPASESTAGYKKSVEWKPKPSRHPVELQFVHDMIAEAEAASIEASRS